MSYNQSDIVDCFEVVRFMLKESTQVDRQFTQDIITEKQFSRAYETADIKLRQLLIAGAKAYSENLFTMYVRRVISQSLIAARRQGKPSIIADIQAYLNVIHNQLPENLENIKVDGYPLWAMLYFCLRCGNINAALEVAQRALAQGIRLHTLAQCLEKKANDRP